MTHDLEHPRALGRPEAASSVEPEPGRRVSLSPRAWWLFGAILVLAAALRLAQIGKLELWLDEVYSIHVATSPAGVLREVASDTNPPLYYGLLKLWIHGFGIGAGGVRSLSALLGLAQLAALGLWLKKALSPRAALWAMAFGALAPLHIYYAMEARGYTLAWLLLTLALWTFSRAVRSGGGRDWCVHAIVLLLFLYSHSLALFFIPAFWLAALAARLRRRGWAWLLALQGAAGVLYLPWLISSLRLLGALGRSWIDLTLESASFAFAIPRTLELLGIGARMPEMIRLSSPGPLVRSLWQILLGLILVAAALPRGRRRGWPRQAAPALIFLFTPLLLMLGYSLFVRPIYIAGRYDTLVYPAYLALIGLGLSRLQKIIPLSQTTAALILAALLAVLAFFALELRYRPLPAQPLHHPQQARGDVLARFIQPGDWVVCLGLEGAKIEYQMLRHGLKEPMLTFPLATRGHLGWFNPQEVAAQPALLEADAQTILDPFTPPRPRHGRLWVMMDPYSFRPAAPGGEEAAYGAISAVLLRAIAARGLKPAADPDLARSCRNLGIRVYERPPNNDSSTTNQLR